MVECIVCTLDDDECCYKFLLEESSVLVYIDILIECNCIERIVRNDAVVFVCVVYFSLIVAEQTVLT